jgi:RNA polymerase sigma-70 factor (ECF subfamily)
LDQLDRGLGPKPQEDEQDAARRQHVAAVDRLFREHNEALIRFLVQRLHSREAAREVAQEAYVRLLSLHELGAVSFMRAFLYKTAANIAVDRQRRESVHARASGQPQFQEFADSRTPERRTAGAQEIAQIERWLAELPPKCRQAFLLHRFYGLDFAAIAKHMGFSERSARVYVERALLHCRQRMDEEVSK